MGELFFPTEGISVYQLIFLTVVYGYILFQASNLISGGSELLLLIPAISGMVGSIVLPILGAVPDGIMMLFSGTGGEPGSPEVQRDISVGVGTLAGSTVMLLTIPWFIAVWFGRVPMQNGIAKYERKNEKASLLESGVSFQDSIPRNAKIMLVTTLLYFVIQVPACIGEATYSEKKVTGKFTLKSTQLQSESESLWALVGLCACVVAFIGYLVLCYIDANEDKQLEKIIDGISKKEVSLMSALSFIKSTSKSLDHLKSGTKSSDALLPAEMTRLKKVLRPFFHRYDEGSDQKLLLPEFKYLLRDLGQQVDGTTASTMFRQMDTDRNGDINFEEFTECVFTYLSSPQKMENISRRCSMPHYDIEGEDEEEVPEDLADLPYEVQQKRILFRSVYTMGFGLFLVLVFSDPMVDVFSAWGNNVLNVPGFYVSFVLAPLASNASELIAAYNYAIKKSPKSITTSLSTLIGAACMNNTFCLAIFFAVIYMQKVAWQFTAETISIVVIQWIIGALAILKSTHSVITGCIILSCYPLCIFIVAMLELIGLD